MHLNPCLFFDGQCAAAFKFYQHVLGGEITMMLMHADSPVPEQSPPGMRDKIMHARLVNGSAVLMGSDAMGDHRQAPQGFSVSRLADSPGEAERIFEALASGGQVGMPMQATFWAERFGMCVDRFGIPWMVNCEKKA